MPLLEPLRDELWLTGTKRGCGEAVRGLHGSRERRRREQALDADAERCWEDGRDHRRSEREGRSDILHHGNYWPNFGLAPLVFLYFPSAETLWPKPHSKLLGVCDVTTSVPGLENLSVILHDSLLTGIKTAVSP